MAPTFTMRQGIVPGRDHILSGKNCQDAVRSRSVVIGSSTYYMAFVCDGCSSGKFTESGANLGAEYLINQSIIHLKNGLSVP